MVIFSIKKVCQLVMKNMHIVCDFKSKQYTVFLLKNMQILGSLPCYGENKKTKFCLQIPICIVRRATLPLCKKLFQKKNSKPSL